MDFSQAINQELGISKKESASKSVSVRREVKKAEVAGVVAHSNAEMFDIKKYVPNSYLVEALKRFPGSVLNVSPINGAVEFIFGKKSS